MTQLSLFDDQAMRQVKRPARTSNAAYKDYSAFVEKFKTAHTTDDCFTPPAVYEAVLRFVDEELCPLAGREVVRPFYPGGNYKEFPYPEGCIVIDNPPFSIYSKIVRWYCARGIDFFLFAPHLTMCNSNSNGNANANVCFIVCDATITYENGAKVSTSFVTSFCPDLRLWVCPKLRRMVKEACKADGTAQLPRYAYPANMTTTALLSKIVEIDFRVRKDECRFTDALDSQRRVGKSLFGTGWLLSDKAAAEKAAAEKAAARETIVWELSEREKRIIEELNRHSPPHP